MDRVIKVSVIEDKVIELVHEFETLKAKYQTETDKCMSNSLYYQLNYIKPQIDVLKDILMNNTCSFVNK